MRETTSITIGEQIFNIEKSAFENLNRYLDGLKAKFDSIPSEMDSAEVVADIEERIAEIANEILEKRQAPRSLNRNLLTAKDVEFIISKVGNIEEFDIGEPSNQDLPTESPKKLYREPQGRIVAGVCSGLGKRFNINANYFRIAFLSPFFLVFLGAILGFFEWAVILTFFSIAGYLFLALYLPLAQSYKDRLEMTGSIVNINNIRNMAENAAKTLSSESRISKSVELATDTGKDFLVQAAKIAKIAIGIGLILSGIGIIVGLAFIVIFGFTNSDSPLLSGPLRELLQNIYIQIAAVSGFISAGALATLLIVIGEAFVSRIKKSSQWAAIIALTVMILSTISTASFAFRSITEFENFIAKNTATETTRIATPFTRFNAGLEFRDFAYMPAIKFIKSDTQRIEVSGMEWDLRKIRIVQTGDQMVISKIDDNCDFCEIVDLPLVATRRQLTITVYTPDLASIEINGIASVTSEGFENFKFYSNNPSTSLYVSGSAKNTEINIEGGRMEFYGGTLNEALKLTAKGFSNGEVRNMKDVALELSGNTYFDIYSTASVSGKVSENAYLRLTGIDTQTVERVGDKSQIEIRKSEYPEYIEDAIIENDSPTDY